MFMKNEPPQRCVLTLFSHSAWYIFFVILFLKEKDENHKITSQLLVRNKKKTEDIYKKNSGIFTPPTLPNLSQYPRPNGISHTSF